MKKIYVITINESYLRDTQIFGIPNKVTEGTPEEEDWLNNKIDDDNNWYDSNRISGFLGFAYAENEDEAKKIFKSYSPVILEAIEVPCFKNIEGKDKK